MDIKIIRRKTNNKKEYTIYLNREVLNQLKLKSEIKFKNSVNEAFHIITDL